MTRVLVTGATGFLGSHIVGTLLEQGRHVVATGRDTSKDPCRGRTGCSFIATDLSTAEGVSLLSAAGPFGAVVHAAALSTPWGPDAAFRAANIEGTRGALLVARAVGANRFIHISTPSLYFRFADQHDVYENDPLPPPVNAYARTKREAETLVMAQRDIEAIILRPRGIYGPGDTALLPRMIGAASRRKLPLLSQGRATTDITYVGDVVGAVQAALAATPKAIGRAYNISGGESLALTKIIERACARSGVIPQWRPMPTALALATAKAAEGVYARLPGRPEPPITAYGIGLLAFTQTLNIDAARDLLGWVPRVTFERGLDLTFGT